jgi:DNA-binding transcriptional ArsR family regulator
MPERSTAKVAAAFAHDSRAAMVDLLLDGCEHTVGELARAAHVGPSTAVAHVARLERAGVVATYQKGRERLVQLSGAEAAAVFEALSTLASEERTVGLRAWTRREQLRRARTCYDHLAGRLGVAVTDAAVEVGALDAGYGLGPKADAWFGQLGVDLQALNRARRPLVRVCTDWTERRPHLAGALGAALCSAVIDAGWAARQPRTRAVKVTFGGASGLRRLGVAPGELEQICGSAARD